MKIRRKHVSYVSIGLFVGGATLLFAVIFIPGSGPAAPTVISGIVMLALGGLLYAFRGRILSAEVPQHTENPGESAIPGRQRPPFGRPSVESVLAQQVLCEGKEALKVVVLESGAQAGALYNLLIKTHQLPKDRITQLGPTCSDEQIDELLKRARPIVLVSKDLIDHRRCVFRLPRGSNRLVAIQFLDGEVSSFPITCEEPTFQFQLGWFS